MRKRWQTSRREESGFTLIELAIALAILGILVAIAVPTYLGVRNRAYDAEAKQALGEIRTMAWSYFLEVGSWEKADDLAALGMDAGHTTEHWEYNVVANAADSIAICAEPTADAPFDDRAWRLTLDDEGKADLEGPDATCP